MACRFHSPLLLMATLALGLNLNLSPVGADTEASEEGPLVGGLSDADIQDEDVKEALDFAVSEHNKRNNGLYLSKVVKVDRAQQQVVAGINYYFDVWLSQTTCLKVQSNLSNCPINEEQEREPCSFIVNVQAWLTEKTLISSSCPSA